MSSSNRFAKVLADINKPRSKWRIPYDVMGSYDEGKIVPVLVKDMDPGELVDISFSDVIRMSTPIAPIMGNISTEFHAFFVPNRIVWKHWEDFMGENKEGPWVSDVTYNIPTISANSYNCAPQSLADYILKAGRYGYKAEHSNLYYRAYYAIYNEYFRDENLEDPVILDLSDGHNVGSIGGSYVHIDTADSVMTANKYKDYFTACLPAPQKSLTPVSLPLGTFAPIVTDDSATANLNAQITANFENAQAGPAVAGVVGYKTTGTNVTSARLNTAEQGITGDHAIKDFTIQTAQLKADLSNATAATINDLRYAIMLQRMFELDSRFGSRYREQIFSHWGVEAPDLELQIPKHIGWYRQHNNVSQVLQTSGYSSATDSTPLGTAGAYSHSFTNTNFCRYQALEHGMLFVMMVTRHQQTYSQGLHRRFSLKSRFDFYDPVFDHLGEQPVYNKELVVTGDSEKDNKVFGYNEAWAWKRFMPDQVCGYLNPTYDNSLNYWTLANNFADTPLLSKEFIEQDKERLNQCLAQGDTPNVPQFVFDILFDITITAPISAYSVPGIGGRL